MEEIFPPQAYPGDNWRLEGPLRRRSGGVPGRKGVCSGGSRPIWEVVLALVGMAGLKSTGKGSYGRSRLAALLSSLSLPLLWWS